MVDVFLHSPIGCGVEHKPSVPSAGFDPVIATVKGLQIHTLGRTATGRGVDLFYPLCDHPATIGSLFRRFFQRVVSSSALGQTRLSKLISKVLTISYGFSNKLDDQISSDQLF